MSTDGTNQTQVTRGEGGFPLRTSTDGQWLYYRSGLQNTLRRVSVADDQEELVYSATPGDFALSPDTSRVAIRQRENNEYTLSIVSLADKSVERSFRPALANTRPVYVVWSDDGQDLVYVIDDDEHETRSLWSQSLSDPNPRKIADLGSKDVELSTFALSPNAKTLVVGQGTWNHNAVLIRGLKP
jgi:hypothetical protein